MGDLETLIPRTNLQFWHEAEDITGVLHGGNVTAVPDRSSNARNLACASTHPLYHTNVRAGRPGVYFNGAKNPLVNSGGSFSIKHLFVAAAFDDADFGANYQGLFTDPTTIAVLVGKNGTTRFEDFDFEAAGTYRYARGNYAYAENDAQAAMNGKFAVYEVSLSSGWGLIGGFQVGQDRNTSARKMKGYWLGHMGWSDVQGDSARQDIYDYFAMKFQTWREVSPAVYTFPFQPDINRPLAADKRVLTSTAVSGAFKGRTKGTRKLGGELQFTGRWPEEHDAALQFWEEHYPGVEFNYEDKAVSPARNITSRFISGITAQNADYRDMNYSFQLLEV